MNNISKIYSIIFILLVTSCKVQTNLFVETPQENNLINPYNYDNKIFLPDREYIFDYFIIKNLDTLKYKMVNDSVFSYVKWDINSKNVVKYLSIKTLKNKGPIFNDHKDYNQTEIILSHLDENKKSIKQELTGVIENEENLWIHPFRLNAFQILQFAPFPYIKKNTNKEYYWDLKIGKHWDGLQNIDWDGNLTLKCKYKNKNIDTLRTAFGNLKVIETSSLCKSKIGKCYLTTFFNDKFGFMKLIYDLPKNEKIIISLKEVK